MKVSGRNVNVDECPAAIRAYLGQSFVTVGKEYDVHALSVFEGTVMLQIVDDIGMPNWRPAVLFHLVARDLPSDWICNIANDGVSLVMGPAFVAKDDDSYAAMVELESEQVARFWRRVDERKTSSVADS